MDGDNYPEELHWRSQPMRGRSSIFLPFGPAGFVGTVMALQSGCWVLGARPMLPGWCHPRRP